MGTPLFEEGIRRPSARHWLGLAIVVAVVTTIGIASYRQLYPSHEGFSAVADALTITHRATSVETPLPSTLSPLPHSDVALTSLTDSVSGFKIGLPPGWALSTEYSLIWGRADACGTSGVLVYPVVRLDRTLTAASLTHDVLTTIAKQLPAGNELTWGQLTGDEVVASLISGSICSQKMVGAVSSTVSGGLGLVKLTWYPETTGTDGQLTTQKILDSYTANSTGQVLLLGGDGLQLAAPEDWTHDEQAERYRVTSPDGSLMVQLATLQAPADEPLTSTLDTWLTLETQDGAASVVSRGDVLELASSGDWTGVWQEVTLKRAERSVSARVSAYRHPDLSDRVALRWDEATTERWEDEQPRLLTIADSARIKAGSSLLPDRTAALSLPRPPRLDSADRLFGDQLVTDLLTARRERWDSIILGFDTVKTETGTELLAPRSQLQLPRGTYTWPGHEQESLRSEEE